MNFFLPQDRQPSHTKKPFRNIWQVILTLTMKVCAVPVSYRIEFSRSQICLLIVQTIISKWREWIPLITNVVGPIHLYGSVGRYIDRECILINQSTNYLSQYLPRLPYKWIGPQSSWLGFNFACPICSHFRVISHENRVFFFKKSL